MDWKTRERHYERSTSVTRAARTHQLHSYIKYRICAAGIRISIFTHLSGFGDEKMIVLDGLPLA